MPKRFLLIPRKVAKFIFRVFRRADSSVLVDYKFRKDQVLFYHSTFLFFVRSSIAFGRWAHARPSTKRFVFGGSVNCVRTFSWGAAAPQATRDDGLNLARSSAKISPKTKRLVDGRAGAHRPNAINSRKVFGTTITMSLSTQGSPSSPIGPLSIESNGLSNRQNRRSVF